MGGKADADPAVAGERDLSDGRRADHERERARSVAIREPSDSVRELGA